MQAKGIYKLPHDKDVIPVFSKKTRSMRIIPLNKTALKIIARRAKMGNEHLFTNSNGGKMIHPHSWMYRLMVHSGIKADKNQHEFHRLGIHLLRISVIKESQLITFRYF